MVEESEETAGEFAAWLKERLTPRGKTSELIEWVKARKGLTMTPQHVDKWKNGSEPERPRLKAIAEFFGVEYVTLLRMFDPDVPPPAQTRSIHGVTVTEEGAVIGAEWDKLPDTEKRVVGIMVHALVKDRVLAERRETRAGKRTAKPDQPVSRT